MYGRDYLKKFPPSPPEAVCTNFCRKLCTANASRRPRHLRNNGVTSILEVTVRLLHSRPVLQLRVHCNSLSETHMMRRLPLHLIITSNR
ncbi:hypothetical protein BDV96DRAFT_88213 [Lophiotrema nucula]|uniref:Uncharacterized protein n=1 Tax=Lophiotrema nucula TaxID=690887 RepID=A0A6A5Z931_9PLEO|nr:hypothetical protein BDV96DRAFT_88213 [Lophiotrema nucula]